MKDELKYIHCSNVDKKKHKLSQYSKISYQIMINSYDRLRERCSECITFFKKNTNVYIGILIDVAVYNTYYII